MKHTNLALFEGDRATNYDDFVQQWIPNYNYFMSVFHKLLSDQKHKSLLAVGCGTGNELMALKNADKSWSILGVDPSPEMIHIAQAKMASHQNIEFFLGKVGDLKPQQLYGAASLILVLHFIKFPNEKLALFKEIAKRLHPGAPLILMGIFENREQLARNLKVLRTLLPKNISQSELNERLERISTKLYRTPEEELQKLLERAGFNPPTRFFQSSIYSGWITEKLEN